MSALAILATAAALGADPQNAQPAVGIEPRLGEPLPLASRFRDEAGRELELGQLFGERPVLLALVYYECPQLCDLVLDGAAQALRGVALDPGVDFDVVAVSIAADETPGQARRASARYRARYAPSEGPDGWHFLVGASASIEALARAVGFRYERDPDTGLYAHASGVFVVTPQGDLSHVLYGIDYPPRDLRLALVESSRGRIGSAVDRLLLLCLQYDPAAGGYGLAVMGTLRALGVLTVLALGAWVACGAGRGLARRTA